MKVLLMEAAIVKLLHNLKVSHASFRIQKVHLRQEKSQKPGVRMHSRKKTKLN